MVTVKDGTITKVKGDPERPMNGGYGKDANEIDTIIEKLDQRRYLKRMAPAGVGIIRREVGAAWAGFVRRG